MAQFDIDERRIARQRAIAQALRESGNQAFDPAASAGRLVYARSPWEDINKIAQQGLAGRLDYLANKQEKNVASQKDAAAREQLAGMIDTLAGKSQMEPTANPDAQLQDFSNVSVRNPVTGGMESATVGDNQQAPIFTSPALTEQNQKRAALAGILKGADPQAAAAALMGPALSTFAPKDPLKLGEGDVLVDPNKNYAQIAAGAPKTYKPTPESEVLVNVVDSGSPKGYRTIRRADWAGEQLYEKPTTNSFIVPPGSENEIEGLAQSIYNLELPPMPMGTRNPLNAKVMARVSEIGKENNKPYFAGDYGARASALSNFGPGKKAGDTVKAFSVLLDHLDTIEGAAEAMKNGDIPAFNAAAQAIAEQLGSPAPTTLQNLKDIVGSEIIKGITGGPGAEADREKALAALKKSSSPAQIMGILNGVRELAGGQLRGLQQQFTSTTGLPDDRFHQRLSPRAYEWLQKANEDAKKRANDRGGGASGEAPVTKTINGKVYEKTSAGWVEK